jgi:hypothetical protein
MTFRHANGLRRQSNRRSSQPALFLVEGSYGFGRAVPGLNSKGGQSETRLDS